MNMCKFFVVAAFGLYLIVAGTPLLAAPAAAPTAAQPVQTQESARVDAAFAALDTNKDEVLSLQEFQGGHAGLQRAIALEVRLREQFRMVDADRSGAIEAGEFANLVLVRRAGKTAPALSTFDADRNQKLEFAEYLIAVRRLTASQPAAPAKK